MSNKKMELLSTAMKRTSEWIVSLETPSDMIVKTGGISFSLHKFLLVPKCGYIRKLVSESTNATPFVLEIPDVPGGAEAFELAAKFCYGINFEISTQNIAVLRCAAEYLEMTEDYAVGNLITRTETYIKDVVLKSLTGSVSMLHSLENILPTAEKVKLVNRCIDAIALIACKGSQSGTSIRDGSSLSHDLGWWAKYLTILRIDLFQRVLIAMTARGFRQQALVPVLVLYAQKSLRGLEVFGKGRMKIDPREEHEKMIILETIVSLLPRETNTIPISFLSMLLRAAIYLETTVACRLDLEKRMALELGQAMLTDLLIPSYSCTGDTLFDIETVKRIIENFLDFEMEVKQKEYNAVRDYISPSPSDMEQVTRLMEDYLSEVSSDPNLSISNFISLAALIPEQSRVTEDGTYKAIDIYLKAHPDLSEMEKKKVCSTINFQKLSLETCAHVAKNDRLPVQAVIQVVYYEQQRLKEAVDNSLSHYSIDLHPVTDEVSTLQRENQELKLEVMKMETRLKEMEKSSDITYKTSILKSPLPWKSLMSSVSRKFGRFIWADGSTVQNSKGRNETRKVRRHSIS